jgi:hypothetical protein
MKTLPLSLATTIIFLMSILAADIFAVSSLGMLLVIGAVLLIPLSTVFFGLLRRERGWLSKKDGKIVGICLALSLSIWLTQWPLRIAFTLSRPALERAAGD